MKFVKVHTDDTRNRTYHSELIDYPHIGKEEFDAGEYDEFIYREEARLAKGRETYKLMSLSALKKEAKVILSFDAEPHRFTLEIAPDHPRDELEEAIIVLHDKNNIGEARVRIDYYSDLLEEVFIYNPRVKNEYEELLFHGCDYIVVNE